MERFIFERFWALKGQGLQSRLGHRLSGSGMCVTLRELVVFTGLKGWLHVCKRMLIYNIAALAISRVNIQERPRSVSVSVHVACIWSFDTTTWESWCLMLSRASAGCVRCTWKLDMQVDFVVTTVYVHPYSNTSLGFFIGKRASDGTGQTAPIQPLRGCLHLWVPLVCINSWQDAQILAVSVLLAHILSTRLFGHWHSFEEYIYFPNQAMHDSTRYSPSEHFTRHLHLGLCRKDTQSERRNAVMCPTTLHG